MELPKPYYQDAHCTIYHGDCRVILPLLPTFDAVITDPPYGIEHKSNGQWFTSAKPVANDDSLWAYELLDCYRDCPLVCFFSPYKPVAGWRSVLAWSKGGHVGIGGDRETCWKRDFELIGVKRNKPLNGGRDSGVLVFNAVKSDRHFCEKPVPLMCYLVSKITNAGETILDPFCGSGSTLVAAKLEGRKAVGIELEEAYCEIAAERLRQGVLF